MNRIMLAGLLFMVVGFSACDSSEDGGDGAPVEIRYRVTGSGSAAVTYTTDEFRTTSLPSVALPFDITFSFDGLTLQRDFAYVKAQALGDGDIVQVEIFEKGIRRRLATTQGKFSSIGAALGGPAAERRVRYSVIGQFDEASLVLLLPGGEINRLVRADFDTTFIAPIGFQAGLNIEHDSLQCSNAAVLFGLADSVETFVLASKQPCALNERSASIRAEIP